MLERAHKLKQPIQRFITATDDRAVAYLALAEHEWRHVEYLLQLLREFYYFTNSLSKHHGVTVHKVSSNIHHG